MKKKYKLGYVQGTFDMFHRGHLNLLQRAKKYCDRLLVGVVSDELNIVYKHRRPLIPYEDRASIVAAIRDVNSVIKVDIGSDDKIMLCKKYHFDAHFSGDDHAEDSAVLATRLLKQGCEMVFFPYTQKVSSSKLRVQLKNRILYNLAADLPLAKIKDDVVVYGAGDYGLDIYRYLQSLGKTVILVDKRYLDLSTIKGISVKAPASIISEQYEQVILATIVEKTAREMREQLEAYGVNASLIFWPLGLAK